MDKLNLFVILSPVLLTVISADLGQIGSPKLGGDKQRHASEPGGPQPYPLPMPAYGGYFAPLSHMLPDSGQSGQPFLRYFYVYFY